ncbi:MAG TPA: T9SS type A sorting domain-containing protein, partial [Chitinophagales bacterium]|nr:T9SS type A sorting domain-containing protein [Chitinophagales bacterium]
TYQWSNSATTATISNLPAATYTVIATDTNGCSVSASATVATNNIPFTVNASATTSSCVANTGMAWAAASAGNSPYTYLWNNTSTTDTILNLGPGNYRVTVTDAHGCSTTASTSVTTATGPSATDSVVDILCNGGATGSAMVTVSGGTSPIVYNWSNGATTSSITGLTAGNYTVTITDNNSCSFTLTAFISEPPGLLASSTASNLNCYGDSNGSVDVTVSGGTSPYSYTWNNSTTTQNLSNVAAGVYTLVVTDSNNCTISLSDTITQPTALVVTINATDASSASASDGSASADISGGTAPYTIVWNTSSTHDTITHLSADSYCATVTDNAGCTANACDSVGYPTAIVSINNKPVKIYPNPATNNITVEIPQGSILVFSIYNIEGRLVETEKLAGPKTQINVTNLPSGPYLFRIIDVATGSNSSGKIQVIK